MKQHNAFYFGEGPYLQTLQGLHSALSAPEAFVKLLGNPQTGKSTLCEKLAQYMRRKGFRVIFFKAAVESPDMLRTMLARELKLPVSSNFARMIEDTLVSEDGRPIVLIFDDAHLLTDITLLEIYRLAEVQVQKKRVLNILLCGELSLEKRLLSKHEFKTMLLSVSNRYELTPMDRETLGQFLYRYVEKCGVPGLQLEPAAMNILYKSCRGYPGPALSLCRLLVESRQGSTDIRPVSKSELTQVLKNNAQAGLPGGLKSDSQNLRPLLPIAAVIMVASVGFLYQQIGNDDADIDSQSAVAEPMPSPFAAGEEAAVETPAEPPSTAGQPEQDSGILASASSGAEQIDAAETTPDVVAVASVEDDPPVSEPPIQPDIPTLPAEIPEPVSDSSLALVTAEEIGVADDAISQPEFEPLSAEVVSDRNETASEMPEEEVSPAQPAQAEPEPQDAEVIVATNALAVVRAEDDASSAAGPLDADPVAQLEAAVLQWLTAWEAQSLDDYFASYHSGFTPRYHDSVAAWRNNRQRVIGGASSIKLTPSDFEHVGVEEGMQDVRLWLRYESPNYSDSTLKKLLLLEEEGVWKIVEEINLQVRP
jgi:type II secretory pathway predicted ATPase ExeA